MGLELEPGTPAALACRASQEHPAGLEFSVLGLEGRAVGGEEQDVLVSQQAGPAGHWMSGHRVKEARGRGGVHSEDWGGKRTHRLPPGQGLAGRGRDGASLYVHPFMPGAQHSPSLGCLGHGSQGRDSAEQPPPRVKGSDGPWGRVQGGLWPLDSQAAGTG